MNSSNFILIQLNHLKEDIDKRFHSKIIQIGETTSSEVEVSNKSGNSFIENLYNYKKSEQAGCAKVNKEKRHNR